MSRSKKAMEVVGSLLPDLMDLAMEILRGGETVEQTAAKIRKSIKSQAARRKASRKRTLDKIRNKRK